MASTYVKKCPTELCAGCGRQTRSSTGFCAVEPWCRAMAQRFSYSNRARIAERHANGKRGKYQRRNPEWESMGILTPLEGLTVEEYDRRVALVKTILEHKAAKRAKATL